jgi:hypothetical protein
MGEDIAEGEDCCCRLLDPIDAVIWPVSVIFMNTETMLNSLIRDRSHALVLALTPIIPVKKLTKPCFIQEMAVIKAVMTTSTVIPVNISKTGQRTQPQ